jgi:hypothetical protein
MLVVVVDQVMLEHPQVETAEQPATERHQAEKEQAPVMLLQAQAQDQVAQDTLAQVLTVIPSQVLADQALLSLDTRTVFLWQVLQPEVLA